MAKSTELQYYPDATASCSNCGSIFTLGMTVEKITVEICGNCHPFYTGQETLIDTAGRIEKFQARASQIIDGGSKKAKTKSRKTRQSLADLSTGEEKSEETKPKNVKKVKEVKSAETVIESTKVVDLSAD
ncbi:MAG: 50S ribosomal protein L31 [candidate division SR1 bacterium]|nr:50S ribosomal protein L31 [candidate division SR1 bacterium]